ERPGAASAEALATPGTPGASDQVSLGPPQWDCVSCGWSVGSAGHDAHGDLRLDLGVQPHEHRVVAERLDGLGQLHLAPIDLRPADLGHRVGYVGGGDGAEE